MAREPMDVRTAEELCRRIDRLLEQLHATRDALLQAIAPPTDRRVA